MPKDAEKKVEAPVPQVAGTPEDAAADDSPSKDEVRVVVSDEFADQGPVKVSVGDHEVEVSKTGVSVSPEVAQALDQSPAVKVAD